MQEIIQFFGLSNSPEYIQYTFLLVFGVIFFQFIIDIIRHLMYNLNRTRV